MARIADYRIVTDKKHHLNKDSVRPERSDEFSFALETGAHVGSPGVLSFVLKVAEDSTDLFFRVEINGSDQVEYQFSGFRSSSTLHEVIDKNVLIANGQNTIQFHLDSGAGAAGAGRGSVRFSDVVLFYQRDI